MQSKFFLLIFLFAALFSACDENAVTDMGSVLQTDADKIKVGVDTFHLDTDNFMVPFMVSRPDSFLLGSFIDKHFGTTNADFFMQVEPALNFDYPAGAVADSAELILQYSSWFGYQYSPMEVSVYLMDKNKTFDYTKTYFSNLNVAEYSSKTNLIGKKSFTARDALLVNAQNSTVKMKLSENFSKTIFAEVLKKKYSNLNTFLSDYPGFYVTSNFGSATMLHVSSVVLRYHFHYKYKLPTDTDSTTVSAYINYPANSWVRQINRVEHPDTAIIRQKLELSDSVNFISSPANVYTRVNLPIKRMKDKINNSNNKRLNINSAQLKIHISEIAEMSDVQRVPEQILLVRDTDSEPYSQFFSKRQLPNTVSSVLGNYGTGKDEITGETAYFYSFDLAALVENELKNNDNENASYILVPVSVKQNSAGSIIEVKEQNLMRSVSICSGKNKQRPMKLNLVYSLF